MHVFGLDEPDSSHEVPVAEETVEVAVAEGTSSLIEASFQILNMFEFLGILSKMCRKCSIVVNMNT